MTPPADCFVLQAHDFWLYRRLTFPAFRGWLDTPCDPGLVAVGLRVDGASAGLALGWVGDDGQATLASVFVLPEHRGQGGATALLAHWSRQAAQSGATAVQATWRSGQPTTAAVEALLARAGWSAPQPRMLVVVATLASIADAPWIRPQALPADMRILPWQAVDAEARAALRASHAESPWIAPDLVPFDHEAGCEPNTSCALVWKGDVVGWVINHAVDGVLRFTCSFMHPRLQRLGRIVLLYQAAVARMPAAGFDTGMWTVPVWHPRMADFARRWMAPHATRFDETRGAGKSLAAG